MTAIKDQIKAAETAASDLRPIEIEAWGTADEPLVVYAKQMTVAMLKKISKHANAKRGNEIETLVYTIIFAVCDAKGDAVFDLGDKQWLLNEAGSDVLADVVLKINTRPSYENLAAN